MDTQTAPPETEVADAVQTVDVMLHEVVLKAATERVRKLQTEERAAYGTTHTKLANVARTILLEWPVNPVVPAPAPRRSPSAKMNCPVCERRVTIKVDGYLRAHGPADARCPGLATPVQQRAGEPVRSLKPFRFEMPRERYQLIKKDIHGAGTTVAHVLTTQLTRFARTGKY